MTAKQVSIMYLCDCTTTFIGRNCEIGELAMCSLHVFCNFFFQNIRRRSTFFWVWVGNLSYKFVDCIIIEPQIQTPKKSDSLTYTHYEKTPCKNMRTIHQ